MQKSRLPHTTIGAASRALSGMLFLEDRSILSSEAYRSNVSGYLYTNPNAEHNVTKTLFWDYALCDLELAVWDTFQFDNY